MNIAWEEIQNSTAFINATPEQQALARKNYERSVQGLDLELPEPQQPTTPTTIETISSEDRSLGKEFTEGVKRGVDSLQASLYGAKALAGKGLYELGFDDTGNKVKESGIEGYVRNIKQAGEHEKSNSFKDVYTGKAGLKGAAKWAVGTLGELAPSMVEAGVGAAVGAAATSYTGAGAIGGGIAGGIGGRTLIKKAINKEIKRAVEKGLLKEMSEEALRQAVTKQTLNKLGARAGLAVATEPINVGDLYGELYTEKGIDAPGSALFFGSLMTAVDQAGGNAKTVDSLVDAVKAGKGIKVKKSAKEILKSIPEEAGQEATQEVLTILNTVANTKEDAFTLENLEQVIEAGAAGALGGTAGAGVQAITNFSGSENTDETETSNQTEETETSNQTNQTDQTAQTESTVPAEPTEQIATTAVTEQTIQPQDTINTDAIETVDNTDFAIITDNGVPYKNKEVLEKEIAAMPDADKYDILEAKDGFIAVRSNQRFTNEQQQQAQELTTEPNQVQAEQLVQQEQPVQQDQTITQEQTVEAPAESFIEQTQAPENVDNIESTQTVEDTKIINEQPKSVADVLGIEQVKQVFPKQEIVHDADGVTIKLDNGQQVKIKTIQQTPDGFMKLAINTNQISDKGKIFGATINNEILLDENYADNATLWHESKHVFDNLGIITKKEDSLLNAEFNKLRKAGKLNFTPSTHDDPVIRMQENRANTFAQLMVNREKYKDTAIGKMIQDVIDFYQKLLALGKQTIADLARSVESGKIYQRPANDITNTTDGTQQADIVRNEVSANEWRSVAKEAIDTSNIQSAKAGRWYNQIKKYPGVKDTELGWSGLTEWLKENPNRVITKEELSNWFAENQTQLKEVVFHESPIDIDRMNEIIKDTDYHYVRDDETDYVLIDKNGDIVSSEVLTDNQRKAINKVLLNYVERLPKYSEYTIEDENNLNNVSDNKEFILTWDIPDSRFKAEHWKNIPNQVVTIRTSVITRDDGSKVLHIDEIQSDWDKAVQRQGEEEVGTNPWTEKTMLLALRRMIRYAAENNMDAISWSDSDIQTKRWKSEQFWWVKYPDVDGIIVQGRLPYANVKETGIINSKEDLKPLMDKIFAEKKNTYSKENYDKYLDRQAEKLWKKIQENTTEKPQVYKPREEAFKQIYDKSIYNTLKKEFGKSKWGNPKFEFIEQDGLKLPSIEITSRMKQKALREGMPLFKTYSTAEQAVSGLLNNPTDINTEDFRNWFSSSMLIDETNKPQVFYHGTDAIFDEFKDVDNRKSGHTASGLGIFLSPSKKTSKSYGQHVLPVYVKITAPYYMTLKESQQFKNVEESKQFRKDLIDQGYDGVIIDTGDKPYVVAFESGQVKSIYNQGKWKDDKKIYFQTSEQKVSDKEYMKSYKTRHTLINQLKYVSSILSGDLKTTLEKMLVPISTRLRNADKSGQLTSALRTMDYNIGKEVNIVLKDVHNMCTKLKRAKMSAKDRHIWNIARLQGDEAKVQEIATRYGITQEVENVRQRINDIRQKAKAVGFDVGFIDEYWPRIIKDMEGFLKATKNITRRQIFTEAMKKKAKEMGITLQMLEEDFPEIKASIITNLILHDTSSGVGATHMQSRVYDVIPSELLQYYADADTALMEYTYSMIKKIEARKFFGKIPAKIQSHQRAATKYTQELNTLIQLQELTPDQVSRISELDSLIKLHKEKVTKYKHQNDFTENIGVLINQLIVDGHIKAEDESVVRDTLMARFNEHGTHGVIGTYKNLSYIDVMGSPIAALTQIGDLVWGAYVGKVWTLKGAANTAKILKNAILNKSQITREDVGLIRTAQEFADSTAVSKLVDMTFNMVGLTKMDAIGKEVLLNAALNDYQQQAKDHNQLGKLRETLKPIFKNDTDKVIAELQNDEITDNVKLLVYSRLLDFQPTALSEMTQWYLISGNGRVFYLLKTFTIKQMDVFRNEVFSKLASGNKQEVIQGMKNMTALLSLLTLANASADELKDFMLGKETKFTDHLIDNLLSLGGASRYLQMQASKEGVGSAMFNKLLPPTKFVDNFSKDIKDRIVTNDASKGLRIIEDIPLVGKIWSWRVGRKSGNKKTIIQQDFQKEARRFNKFAKQLEKAEDKRVFIVAHKEEFRQSQIFKKFKSKLNGVQKEINKLKKLPNTPAVKVRIAQLEKRKEKYYSMYFTLTKQRG